MTESYLRNTPIETDRQKIESDLKKELKKRAKTEAQEKALLVELEKKYK